MKLWQLIGTALEDPEGFLAAINEAGGVAVLFLCPPSELDPDERALGLAVHAVIGRGGLLVVF